MARYDRAVMVPYLRDICALHLAKQKVNGMITEAQWEVERIQKDALRTVKPPKLEAYKGPNDLYGIGYGCGGCFCYLMTAILFFAVIPAGPSMLFLPGIFAVTGIILMIYSVGAKNRENARIQVRNDEKEKDHALEEIAALVVAGSKTDPIEEQIRLYRSEIERIDGLLQELYGANVLPGSYRDLYPAVYLDDWFHNSQSDDLDMALDIYTRNQDREMLDQIIRDETEALLRDRIGTAMEHMEMEQSEQYHVQLMDKLGQMQLGEEEQNTYQKMIYANAVVDAYFAEAEYLKM